MVSADNRLHSITQSNVLVVGDIMLDRYWFGDVERISPEAPVPIVSVSNRQERMGGAGNVALNVASLGGKCTLLGIVGNDDAGSSIEQTAGKAGIEHVFTVDAEAPTSIKQRIISQNQQLLRADFEGEPSADSVASLVQCVQQKLNDHDVLVLSDYGKGSLKSIEQIIESALKYEIPVFVDPKGDNFLRYSGATMITPNLKEFELVGGKTSDDQDLENKAKEVIDRFNLKQLLVTLSDKGMRLFQDSAPTIHSPARSREVYDVSGAGDTVIAVMAMCLAASETPETAMRIANSAAGIVVSKLGTATATMEELQIALDRDAEQ
ncbi:MAG: D-glycero-beta-D-manno-heptose-7-phosphate kinase [bacterium]